MDPYGITVDSGGRVWMAGQNNSLYSYDSVAGTWANYKPELDAFFASTGHPSNILRGLMMDTEGSCGSPRSRTSAAARSRAC